MITTKDGKKVAPGTNVWKIKQTTTGIFVP